MKRSSTPTTSPRLRSARHDGLRRTRRSGRYFSKTAAPQCQGARRRYCVARKGPRAVRVFTWNDYQTRVHDFALGLLELGLGRGDVIGIIGDNRPDWVAAEIATHAVGAMSL